MKYFQCPRLCRSHDDSADSDCSMKLLLHRGWEIFSRTIPNIFSCVILKYFIQLTQKIPEWNSIWRLILTKLSLVLPNLSLELNLNLKTIYHFGKFVWNTQNYQPLLLIFTIFTLKPISLKKFCLKNPWWCFASILITFATGQYKLNVSSQGKLGVIYLF